MTQKDQKGSMITDTFTINLGHCARACGCVHVFDFCHISNDGNNGVKICISPTYIEPSVYQGMHQCWILVSDTDGRTDRWMLICLLTGVLDGRKTKLS